MAMRLEDFYRLCRCSQCAEDLRALYAEAAEQSVAEARRGCGCDGVPSPGYAKLYAEAIDRGVAFRGARVSTLESTLNLKQNELLALIAHYGAELNQMISARATSTGAYRDENGPGLKGLVQAHVARIAQLSAELA